MSHFASCSWTRTLAGFGVAAGLVLAAGALDTHADLVVLEDTFTDGDRTENPTWYLLNDTANANLSVVDDSGGIGSGNAMKLSITGAGSGMHAAGANFNPVTLASVGDSITVAFDARWTATATSARLFSIALWDTAGTPLYQDGDPDTAVTDGVGYVVKVDSGGADEGGRATIYQSAPGHHPFNTSFAGGRFADGSSDSNALTQTVKRFSMVIERTADTAEGDMADARVTFLVNGVVELTGLLSDHSSSDTPLFRNDTFGNVAIGFNSPNTVGDLFIDNVSVTTNVPEPASLALAGLGGALCLLRRRR